MKVKVIEGKYYRDNYGFNIVFCEDNMVYIVSNEFRYIWESYKMTRKKYTKLETKANRYGKFELVENVKY